MKMGLEWVDGKMEMIWFSRNIVPLFIYYSRGGFIRDVIG